MKNRFRNDNIFEHNQRKFCQKDNLSQLKKQLNLFAYNHSTIQYSNSNQMHFSKFLNVSQIQTNTQFISDHLNKSPTNAKEIQKKYEFSPLQKKSHNYSASAATLPFLESEISSETRQQQLFLSPHQQKAIKSHANSSGMSNFMASQRPKTVKMAPKLRKYSENNVIYENQQAERDGDEQIKSNILPNNKLQSSKVLIKPKDRKSSCNLDAIGLFKKLGRKNSDQTDLIDEPKKERVLIKKKSLGWDQNNNFQFGSNLQTEGLSQSEITSSSQQFIPIKLRKQSDKVSSPRKVLPSFLTGGRMQRKSLNVSDIFLRKQISIQDFIIIKEMGKGTFGRVVLAAEKQSRMLCSIKIMSKRQIKQNNMLQQLVRQIKIQLFINHPNIIKVYGFFDDLLHFYIIMECALDGHLSEYIKKTTNNIPEQQAGVMLNQICSAVSQLHTESIIHRDLKPQNVLLQNEVVKICDFGWSVRRDSKLRTTFCGTPVYLCPQILLGDEYDESVDIWTVGVILYELIYKTNPFRITCKEDLINILNEPIYFDEKVPISHSTKNFIQICLSKRGAERPNIRELLIHEFLLNAQSIEEMKQ